ncbi:hypothetical protein BGX38DRAFT_1271163 [Terfezia claveryi]|nr:hypothetical protein BGX38DRAFT_1271163 [Terfezia claveryi]
MTKFWDKVLEVILSRGQRERHEKYLWDKQCGISPATSISSTSSLDRTITPEFKPTVKPAEGSSPVTRLPTASSPTLHSPSTPLTQHSSPAGSPTHQTHPHKATNGLPPRAPLPRRQREDRPYFSLEPLIEAQKLTASEKPWTAAIELPPPKLPLPNHEKASQRQPLLYEVPPLSQTQGIGRYRRSVNATEEFIDSRINKRNDSFADLSTLRKEKPRAGSDEYIRPAKILGNMDTTSPPPPRKAFSRGNSPVRLAIYGEAVNEVGEEELEEIDGRLIFGRRKRAVSAVRGTDSINNEGEAEKVLVTTSDPGVTTTEAVVAAIAEEKITVSKKTQGSDEENVRGRRKTMDARNLNRPTATKLKGDIKARIRHATTSEDVEEAVETDEGFEEVESFSEGCGAKFMKGSKGSKEKSKTPPKAQEVGRKNRKTRGPGQGAGAGTGNTGLKAVGGGGLV